MTPSPLLKKARSTGNTIVTARRRLGDGSTEPALDVRRARVPGLGPINRDSTLFTISDSDPFRGGRLAVIALNKAGADEPAEMRLLATSKRLGDDPASLGEAIHGLMEKTEIVEVVVDDTNVPEAVLRSAGATAISGNPLEFRV